MLPIIREKGTSTNKMLEVEQHDLDLEVCALNHQVMACTVRGHQQPAVEFDWDEDDCKAEFCVGK